MSRKAEKEKKLFRLNLLSWAEYLYQKAMENRKYMLIIMLSIFFPIFLNGEVIKLYDVPSAQTLLRGFYSIDTSLYNNGGILTRLYIGLTDRLMLGIVNDIGGAIGSGEPDWNIPGVAGKVNILFPDEETMGVAIGYDLLAGGDYGKAYNSRITDEVVYGAYLVCTKLIHLFAGGQTWHFGIRVPILPAEAREKGKNISLFTGLYIEINEELKFIGEVENIYLNGGRGKEILYNGGIKYFFNENFDIGLIFQYTSSPDLNPSNRVSRTLFIEYQNIFY